MTDAIAVAAGLSHTLALKRDTTVVAWGLDGTRIPGLTNVVAVAVGDSHDLAIANLRPSFAVHPTSQVVYAGMPVTFNVAVRATPTATLQWHFNGEELPNASNVPLNFTDVRVDQTGFYLSSRK